MITRINRPKDLLAGALYIAGGGTTFLWAQKYEIGTATRMGPGYFPALLGLALVVFGIAATVKAWSPSSRTLSPSTRSLRSS